MRCLVAVKISLRNSKYCAVHGLWMEATEPLPAQLVHTSRCDQLGELARQSTSIMHGSRLERSEQDNVH